MELNAGARVGSSAWIVVTKLGSGAFGDVYETEHDITHKRGACKVLKPVAAGEKGDVVRDKTLRASRLLARAEHPNLVEVYDAGYLETNPPRNWVVMELLRGREVSKVLQEEGRLETSRAVRYIEAAASAVATTSAVAKAAEAEAAAREGRPFDPESAMVVHRDLKPDNLFVTDRDVLKVLDFDSAHMPRAQSMIGSIVGTPLYMSPEHYRGSKLDTRTDVWALGVILYEMLTGRRPFGGANMAELAAAVITRPVPLPEDVFIAPEVWALLQKALEKDRDHRHADMADFAAALQALRQDRSSGAASAHYVETERLSADHLSAVVSSVSGQARVASQPAPSSVDATSPSTRQAYAAPGGAAAPSHASQGLSVGAAVGLALGALVLATGAVVGVTSMMGGRVDDEPAAAATEEASVQAPPSPPPPADLAEDDAPPSDPSASAPAVASTSAKPSAPPSPPPVAPPPAPAAHPALPSPPPPPKGHVRW